MTRIEHWKTVSALFDAAMDRPAHERDAFVEAATADPDTASAVIRLVRAAERETGFMATSGPAPRGGPQLPAGTRLGAWQVDALIGQGGMGEVYAVHRADGLYDQAAALKLIRSADAAAWARFSRERQVLARLEHPGIGRLIDGGVSEDGRPFMVTERIEGVPATEHADRLGLSLSGRIALLCAVADALAHAHARLVLHRDVKPSNVMVTADGQVKLIDFGVAALLAESDEDLAAPATLAYAAPEQLAGAPVSTATDVFGLAMLAHELITGELPARGEGGGVAIAAAGLTADLRAVLSRALASDPARRYDTVPAFARDLRHVLAHRPVSAREGGAAYRAGLFLRRNQTAAGMAAALVLALAGGLVSTTAMAHRASEEARKLRLAQELESQRVEDMNVVTERLGGLMVSLATRDDAAAEAVREELQAAIRTGMAGLADPETRLKSAADLLVLAVMLVEAGEYELATSLLEAVRASGVARERLVATANQELGIAYVRLGRTDKALRALDAARAFYATRPDLYSYELATSANFRAEATGTPADREAAIGASEAAIAWLGRDRFATDYDHKLVIQMQGWIARHLAALDRPGAAADRLADALAATRSLTTTPYTPPHELQATLASYLEAAGRRAEALAAWDRAIEGFRQAGDAGPLHALALTASADALSANGARAEAAARYRAALEMLEQAGKRDNATHRRAGDGLARLAGAHPDTEETP